MDANGTGRHYSNRVKYLTRLEQVPQLSGEETDRLKSVTDLYAFQANDYYLSLIDWNDPDDPIRRLVIPRIEELTDIGDLDASHEIDYTVARGVQHKYRRTVVLLVSRTCAAYCRFCFRKRLFMPGNDEAPLDVEPGLRYIAETPQVTNVLISGGDPLMLSTGKLEHIISRLSEIHHLRIIRIGTKVPGFNPYRILDDGRLHALIDRFSSRRLKIYVITHFTHPHELTEPAENAVGVLQRSGAICANQTSLLAGINDDPEILGELFTRLSWIGSPPYYMFQCRPTQGNAIFRVPLVKGHRIFQQALAKASDLGRRARYVMSHHSGKIEILGVDERCIYFRYHRAANHEDEGCFMIYRRDDRACWFDDLKPAESPGLRRVKTTGGREDGRHITEQISN